MAAPAYALVFRRYAPFKSFGGGFEGDNRPNASTRDNVTYRTSATVNFDRAGVIQNYGRSSGTEWLVGGKSRADVAVKITHERLSGNRVVFRATSEGANPLVPGAPDIDTQVLFGAVWVSGRLVVTGFVTGDGFPNAEVFIRDRKRKAVLLVDYQTGSGAAGPFHRLFGSNSDNQFAKFECVIRLKPDGSFEKVVRRAPHIFTGDRGALRSPVPSLPSITDLLNPRNWM